MKKILTAVIIGLSVSAMAQSGKLKRADNYYNKVSYALAAEQYEELIGSEVDSPKMKSKLATSYYKIGNYAGAIKYFRDVVYSGDATSDDIYYYAQALKKAEDYPESDKWMKKFISMNPQDLRATEFIASPDYLEKITSKSPHFELKNLEINSEFSDFGGYQKEDGTVYFLSARKSAPMVKKQFSWNNRNFLDIYQAQRTQNNELKQVTSFSRKTNTRFHEGPLCFTADKKRVYFTRNNISKGSSKRDKDGIQKLKLFYATVNPDGTWSNEKEITFNSKEYSVGHPVISPDGKLLYFASDMPGGFGGADLYVAEILQDGNLGTPKNLGNVINTEGQEMFPWMTADGLLFFASDGHTGLGGLDNYVAIPDSKSGNFKKVTNLGKVINSSKDDFALVFNADNKTGFLSSNREGGKGEDDIYAFNLIKPFEEKLIVKGVITDVNTKEILPNALIKLVNKSTGEIIASVSADAQGNYEFPLEPELNYQLLVSRGSYFDNQGTVSTVNLPGDVEVIEKDLALEKDPGLALYCLVKDKATGLPLEGVKLRILDNLTNKEFISVNTPATGDAKRGITDKKIEDRLSYNIVLEKEGYLSKTVTFNHKITKPGVIKVNETMDLTMDKIEIGMDLASIIDIKPIYFDLGKYNIRKDAAAELDKIVKVMNDYPTMVVELGSHTDCRSSYDFNKKLSANRATASAEYVKKRITNPERIYGKGYGESKLKNDCACEGAVKSTCTEEQHQENRRTEFIIIKM